MLVPGALLTVGLVYAWVLFAEAQESAAAARETLAELRGKYVECRTVVGFCGDALVTCEGWQQQIKAALSDLGAKCEGL